MINSSLRAFRLSGRLSSIMRILASEVTFRTDIVFFNRWLVREKASQNGSDLIASLLLHPMACTRYSVFTIRSIDHLADTLYCFRQDRGVLLAVDEQSWNFNLLRFLTRAE